MIYEFQPEVKDKESESNDLSRDIEWFEENREELRRKYIGGYVAIYRCVIIDHSTDRESLFQKVKRKHRSSIPFYLGKLNGSDVRE